MARALVRWAGRTALAAGMVGAVVAVARSRRWNGSGSDALIPSIGGDTWPPVPVNPDRPR